MTGVENWYQKVLEKGCFLYGNVGPMLVQIGPSSFSVISPQKADRNTLQASRHLQKAFPLQTHDCTPQSFHNKPAQGPLSHHMLFRYLPFGQNKYPKASLKG
jgi:hypothetical protein